MVLTMARQFYVYLYRISIIGFSPDNNLLSDKLGEWTGNGPVTDQYQRSPWVMLGIISEPHVTQGW